jgi:hypothetical protein
MNEDQSFGVLIISHDEENSYGRTALLRATETLDRLGGIVRITPTTFVVHLRRSLPGLMAVFAQEAREPRERRLHFALFPCVGKVFGDLAEGDRSSLNSLGLDVWDAPVPPHASAQ